jgi:thiamine transporter ThiT
MKIALFIGTVVGLINHFDEIYHGTFNLLNTFQVLLTYLVPFSVATYSASMQARHVENCVKGHRTDCETRPERLVYPLTSEKSSAADSSAGAAR